LRRVLSATGHDFTGLEIAETLWLARYMPTAVARGIDGGSVSTRPSHDPTRLAASGGLEPTSAEPIQGSDSTASDSRPVPLHAARKPVEGIAGLVSVGQPSRYIRIRTGRPLSPTLDILRALRPLKRFSASACETELDEEATAERTARCRRWVPVMRGVQAPWHNLALVIDKGPTTSTRRLPASLC
jgi:hypothetical protein